MKTSELTGASLNWAVAKCEGFERHDPLNDGVAFSTDWAQGGPIIEREKIAVAPSNERRLLWVASLNRPGPSHNQHAATPLIAAMRCYVASKLGNEVMIPEELL